MYRINHIFAFIVVLLFGAPGANATLIGAQNGQLFTIDPLTAAASLIGVNGISNLDIAFSPSVVPEPSTLALFVIGLAGLGFSMRRRTA